MGAKVPQPAPIGPKPPASPAPPPPATKAKRRELDPTIELMCLGGPLDGRTISLRDSDCATLAVVDVYGDSSRYHLYERMTYLDAFGPRDFLVSSTLRFAPPTPPKRP